MYIYFFFATGTFGIFDAANAESVQKVYVCIVLNHRGFLIFCLGRSCSDMLRRAIQ